MSSTEERLNTHIKLSQERFERGDQQFKILQEQQSQLISQLAQLTSAVSRLSESTKGVVDAYTSVQGAVKVGVALQNIVIWVAKWGVLGTALAAIMNWLLSHSIQK